jgi:hypothetical protein
MYPVVCTDSWNDCIPCFVLNCDGSQSLPATQRCPDVTHHTLNTIQLSPSRQALQFLRSSSRRPEPLHSQPVGHQSRSIEPCSPPSFALKVSVCLGHSHVRSLLLNAQLNHLAINSPPWLSVKRTSGCLIASSPQNQAVASAVFKWNSS